MDYATREAAIPLPATLLTELLQRIRERGLGMEGSHYSEHPFSSRPGGGPKDAFQEDALRTLQRQPDGTWLCRVACWNSSVPLE